MGPINKALLELFRADTTLREAQANLDAATRGVRVQRKRAELAENAHAQTVRQLKQARASQLELDSDLKARDARIEHLREQQQNAQNHKHYQSFLIEINTQKTDRAKVEEQAVAKLQEIEQLQKREAEQRELALAEQQRAEKLQTEIAGKTTELELEIQRLEPLREAAASNVPGAALVLFDKLADNYDGEALAAVGHIEGRTESYYCTACNMELVVDVYNRLMTRDEVLSCPGCGRLLYVPEELTPDKAVRQKKVVRKTTRKKAEPSDKPRKPGAKPARTSKKMRTDLRRILTTAAAEALRQAELAGSEPVEAEAFINGESEGVFRVKDADSFRALVQTKLQAEDIETDLAIKQVGGPQPAEPERREAPEAPQPQEADEGIALAPSPADSTRANGDAGVEAPSAIAGPGESRAMDDTEPGETPVSPATPARSGQ